MNLIVLPVLSLALTCIIWGIDVILIQLVLQQMNPILLAFVRLSISSLILLVAYSFTDRKKIDRADRKRVIATGIIGMGLYFFLENLGIQRTSGALASIIFTTVPIMGIIADRIIFKSAITRIKVIAVGIATIGVSVIVTGGSSNSGLKGEVSGYFFMILAAVLWTLFISLSKPLYDKYSLLTIITYQTTIGALFLLPFAASYAYQLLSITPETWMVIITIALVCTIGAEFTYAFSISRLSVTTVASFENIIPVVSVITGYLVFGELITLQQFVGGTIIIASVFFVAFKGPVQREAEVK
jgi:drug/metabolite transporter (DMT)-like permease